MPNFAKWSIGRVEAISAESRAVDAWTRISRRPFAIAFNRDGTLLSSQTVRVEVEKNQPNRQQTEMGEKPVQRVVVFGVSNHPTITDTDMQIGDRFVYEDKEYRLVSVSTQPGELQGMGEVVE